MEARDIFVNAIALSGCGQCIKWRLYQCRHGLKDGEDNDRTRTAELASIYRLHRSLLTQNIASMCLRQQTHSKSLHQVWCFHLLDGGNDPMIPADISSSIQETASGQISLKEALQFAGVELDGQNANLHKCRPVDARLSRRYRLFEQALWNLIDRGLKNIPARRIGPREWAVERRCLVRNSDTWKPQDKSAATAELASRRRFPEHSTHPTILPLGLRLTDKSPTSTAVANTEFIRIQLDVVLSFKSLLIFARTKPGPCPLQPLRCLGFTQTPASGLPPPPPNHEKCSTRLILCPGGLLADPADPNDLSSKTREDRLAAEKRSREVWSIVLAEEGDADILDSSDRQSRNRQNMAPDYMWVRVVDADILVYYPTNHILVATMPTSSSRSTNTSHASNGSAAPRPATARVPGDSAMNGSQPASDSPAPQMRTASDGQGSERMSEELSEEEGELTEKDEDDGELELELEEGAIDTSSDTTAANSPAQEPEDTVRDVREDAASFSIFSELQDIVDAFEQESKELEAAKPVWEEGTTKAIPQHPDMGNTSGKRSRESMPPLRKRAKTEDGLAPNAGAAEIADPQGRCLLGGIPAEPTSVERFGGVYAQRELPSSGMSVLDSMDLDMGMGSDPLNIDDELNMFEMESKPVNGAGIEDVLISSQKQGFGEPFDSTFINDIKNAATTTSSKAEPGQKTPLIKPESQREDGAHLADSKGLSLDNMFDDSIFESYFDPTTTAAAPSSTITTTTTLETPTLGKTGLGLSAHQGSTKDDLAKVGTLASQGSMFHKNAATTAAIPGLESTMAPDNPRGDTAVRQPVLASQPQELRANGSEQSPMHVSQGPRSDTAPGTAVTGSNQLVRTTYNALEPQSQGEPECVPDGVVVVGPDSHHYRQLVDPIAWGARILRWLGKRERDCDVGAAHRSPAVGNLRVATSVSRLSSHIRWWVQSQRDKAELWRQYNNNATTSAATVNLTAVAAQSPPTDLSRSPEGKRDLAAPANNNATKSMKLEGAAPKDPLLFFGLDSLPESTIPTLALSSVSLLFRESNGGHAGTDGLSAGGSSGVDARMAGSRPASRILDGWSLLDLVDGDQYCKIGNTFGSAIALLCQSSHSSDTLPLAVEEEEVFDHKGAEWFDDASLTSLADWAVYGGHSAQMCPYLALWAIESDQSDDDGALRSCVCTSPAVSRAIGYSGWTGAVVRLLGGALALHFNIRQGTPAKLEGAAPCPYSPSPASGLSTPPPNSPAIVWEPNLVELSELVNDDDDSQQPTSVKYRKYAIRRKRDDAAVLSPPSPMIGSSGVHQPISSVRPAVGATATPSISIGGGERGPARHLTPPKLFVLSAGVVDKGVGTQMRRRYVTKKQWARHAQREALLKTGEIEEGEEGEEPSDEVAGDDGNDGEHQTETDQLGHRVRNNPEETVGMVVHGPALRWWETMQIMPIGGARNVAWCGIRVPSPCRAISSNPPDTEHGVYRDALLWYAGEVSSTYASCNLGLHCMLSSLSKAECVLACSIKNDSNRGSESYWTQTHRQFSRMGEFIGKTLVEKLARSSIASSERGGGRGKGASSVWAQIQSVVVYLALPEYLGPREWRSLMRCVSALRSAFEKQVVSIARSHPSTRPNGNNQHVPMSPPPTLVVVPLAESCLTRAYRGLRAQRLPSPREMAHSVYIQCQVGTGRRRPAFTRSTTILSSPPLFKMPGAVFVPPIHHAAADSMGGLSAQTLTRQQPSAVASVPPDANSNNGRNSTYDNSGGGEHTLMHHSHGDNESEARQRFLSLYSAGLVDVSLNMYPQARELQVGFAFAADSSRDHTTSGAGAAAGGGNIDTNQLQVMSPSPATAVGIGERGTPSSESASITQFTARPSRPNLRDLFQPERSGSALFKALMANPLRPDGDPLTLHVAYKVVGVSCLRRIDMGDNTQQRRRERKWWVSVAWCDERGEYTSHDLLDNNDSRDGDRPASPDNAENSRFENVEGDVAEGTLTLRTAAKIWGRCLEYQRMMGGRMRCIIARLGNDGDGGATQVLRHELKTWYKTIVDSGSHTDNMKKAGLTTVSALGLHAGSSSSSSVRAAQRYGAAVGVSVNNHMVSIGNAGNAVYEVAFTGVTIQDDTSNVDIGGAVGPSVEFTTSVYRCGADCADHCNATTAASNSSGGSGNGSGSGSGSGEASNVNLGTEVVDKADDTLSSGGDNNSTSTNTNVRGLLRQQSSIHPLPLDISASRLLLRESSSCQMSQQRQSFKATIMELYVQPHDAITFVIPHPVPLYTSDSPDAAPPTTPPPPSLGSDSNDDDCTQGSLQSSLCTGYLLKHQTGAVDESGPDHVRVPGIKVELLSVVDIEILAALNDHTKRTPFPCQQQSPRQSDPQQQQQQQQQRNFAPWVFQDAPQYLQTILHQYYDLSYLNDTMCRNVCLSSIAVPAAALPRHIDTVETIAHTFAHILAQRLNTSQPPAAAAAAGDDNNNDAV